MNLIRIGTPLHDIGKIGIDDAILRKPDKLTPEEFEIMKLHTVKGAKIVNTVPDLRPIIPIVRFASRTLGRPRLSGRLSAAKPSIRWRASSPLADAFDAMTSRSALSQGHGGFHRVRGDREDGREAV